MNYDDFYKQLDWIFEVISLPEKLPQKILMEKVHEPMRSKAYEVTQWCSSARVTSNGILAGTGMALPASPSLIYPYVIKAVVTQDMEYVQHLPSLEDIGFHAFAGNQGVYIKTQKVQVPPLTTLDVICLPDLRDLERILLNAPYTDYLSWVHGLPLAEQLEQEVTEARKCHQLNLHVATITTLSIAMETASKVVLESKNISYHRSKDGLNELLNKLVVHKLLSERDRQAAIALKGLRNSVNHGHSGTVSASNSNMFFASGEDLLRTILSSITD